MASERFQDEAVSMESRKASQVINRTGVGRWPEFNVVLADHEIAGGMRAKECFDDLTRLHGDLFRFNCRLWNFELMREPELFEAAAQDASRAQMIVIATRRSEAISGDAKAVDREMAPFQGARPRRDSCVAEWQGRRRGQRAGHGCEPAENGGTMGGCVFVQRSWLAGDGLAIRGDKPRARCVMRRDHGLRQWQSPDAGQPRWGLNE